ncbi:hemicentin-1-like [Acropora palmata]|uniref:hemicentin-1-like n=1 Tax=Acropora palmata TaxID=6131 RepID=UPI003DA0D77F
MSQLIISVWLLTLTAVAAEVTASHDTGPHNKVVIEGATVTLHCNATGNSAPNITWTKDRRVVGKEEKLSFQAYRNHSGVYWCSTDNGFNRTFNVSYNLDVHYPPSLKTRPTKQTVLQGTNVTMSCSATGNPIPKITWFKDGKAIGSGETLSLNVQRNVAGKYWCSADNGVGEAVNANADIDVQYPPSLKTRPSKQTVLQGTNVTMSCSATGNPIPKITWFKDGKAIGSGETLSLNVQRNVAGKYWCSADNGVGEAVNASADIDVQYPPSLKTRPTKQTVLQGTNVTMSCSATGNPIPKITWFKDGKAIGSGETLSLNVQRNVAGKYWCSADNGVGEAVNASADIDVQYPPSLKTRPTKQTVLQGTNVTMSCSATGNPIPKITWFKDGKAIGSGETLSLNVQRNVAGKYWCSADNGVGEAVNASADIDVQYPPSLKTRPSKQTVLQGTNVTMSCSATGNPIPKITWFKDGKAIGSGETLSLNVQRNVAGKYWCSADNGVGEAVNASADIDVQYPPSLKTRPSKQTVLQGTNVTMSCSATGNPIPKITWFKDGKAIGSGETLSLNVQRNVAGKYWCSADNGVGEAVNASADIDVQYPPSLKTRPTKQTVLQGTNVTMSCSATGNPIPKITWFKDGKAIGSGETLSLNVQRNVAGKYWCSADNGVGEAVNASADIDVQYPPSLKTRPTKQTVLQGTNVTMSCSATGNPIPKITWFKDGKAIGSGETLSLNVQRNVAGKYWCSADNGVGEAVNASADIDVQYPPSLKTRPSKQTVLQGTNVTMSCSATGNPIPKITWFKDGKAIGSGETLSLNVQRNVAGKYWCSADNGVGEAVNASADIDVQYPPSLKTRPTKQTVLQGTNVTMSCSATGNPIPKITWFKDGKAIGSGETLSLNVQRNVAGKYWCSADNGVGEAVNASADIDVQYPPSLKTRPSKQTVLQGTNVTMSCSATGNPIPKITWFKDGKAIGSGETLSLNVQRNVAGKYWCSADNGVGEAVNASADIDVQYPPSLKTRPSKQTVLQGTNVTMSCSATGNPIPKITWFKDGKAIGSGETLSLNVQRNVAGKYWCSADNGVGEAVNASADIDVQYPPSLKTRPTKQTVLQGTNVTMSCSATGNPIPKITWFKDGKAIGSGETLSLNVQRNVAGKYWCSADNGVGEAVNASADIDVQYPPSLKTRPTKQTVLQGTNVTMSCSATGNPIPKITWFKDGKAIGSGETLSLNVQRNVAGKYWCSADNGVGEAVNASADIDVQYPPSLKTRPTKQTVLQGTNVTMSCSATGNPIPKITWFKDGKAIGSGETLSLNVQRNVAGKYWCSADNGVGEAVNASADIDVQYPPSLKTRPSKQTVLQGTNVTMSCSATGNPIPKITWFKDGKAIGSGETLSLNVQRNVAGKYWCSADNGVGEAVNASADIDVQYPPSLKTRPTKQTVLQGTNVTMSCSATGNPIPKITWFKDGKAIGSGETLSLNVQRNVAGKYWCSADNGVGEAVNASADIDVQYPPSLKTRPSKQTVLQGTNVTMSCSATGNPIPKITWFKDGKAIGSGETLSLNVQRNVAGKYWCSADNSVGEAVNASADIDVQCEYMYQSLFLEDARFDLRICIHPDPPSLKTRPTKQTVLQGTNVTMSCSATGNPIPKITWFKDGKAIGSGETLSLNVQRNVAGKYWCSADNGVGEAVNASADIDVQYPPSLKTRPSKQTVLQGTNVTMSCSATGNPIPKITWFKDGKAIGSGETLSLNVQRNVAGKYWCSADNSVGEAVNASADIDVQYPPSLKTRPTKQTVLQGTNVTMSCSATGNPIPKITWFKDGKAIGSGETLSLNVQRNVAGKYWCSADNGVGEAVNASADIDVQFEPAIAKKPESQRVMESDIATFHCSATGNPAPKIIWTKDDEPLDEGETLSFATNRNHSGLYLCIADNGLSEAVVASAYLDVLYAPRLVSRPSDKTVIETAMVVFFCNATGNPRPQIRWTRDGRPVANGTTLSFDAKRNDTGTYLCSADNGLETSATSRATLLVQYPPSLNTRPAKQSVLQGTNVTMRCSATGNPIPKITWFKDGKAIGSGETLSLNVQRNVAGKYWCSADNGVGEAVNASADIDVQYPPSLKTRPSKQTVLQGTNVTMSCSATGNPIPKITWFKDGKAIGSGETLSLNVQRNVAGKYWCSADNGVGEAVNASADIDVQFPPSVTTRPSNKTVIENTMVAFACSASGNPVPKLTWVKDGESIRMGGKLSFKAARNDSGLYWCLADNGLQPAANSSALLDVQFKPEQTNFSVNVDVAESVPFGISIELTCTTHAHPGADEFKFYRDEDLLGSNSVGFYNLTLERSAVYSCLPFNSIGDGERASLQINVMAWKPSFENILFGPFYLFKGIQARLPCQPFAKPYPTIKWLKDGVTLEYENNGSYVLDSDGTLVIRKVGESDAGRYTCTAQNYLGEASKTADGILLERTKLVLKPQNQTVPEGSSVRLPCRASNDPSLELRYNWKKDGAAIADVSSMQWNERGYMLELSNFTYQDAGVYTCIAYTPEPRSSEDSVTVIVSVKGAPSPPVNLQITDCSHGRTNLSWVPVLSNLTSVTHYLVEQETNHDPTVFDVIYNVTNPNSTSLTLHLPRWSDFRFRVRAVSDVGPSRPSEATAKDVCSTPVGVPETYPSNLRGIPRKANELSITWTPLSKTEWNAPGCYYMLQYKKANSPRRWTTEKIGDPHVGLFSIPNPGSNQMWQFKISAGNHEGPGPESPISRSLSGQDAPDVKPEGAEMQAVTASSVTLEWKPVTLVRGSVDGYKIYYWVKDSVLHSRRRRQAIPSNANVLVVEGGETRQATLTGLRPYNNYLVVVKAFNSGGEGPASALLAFQTSEGVPGPPSDFKTYAFGEYIFVTWKPPQDPNGIITSYQVGSQEYSGSVVGKVPVSMETVQPDVFEKLLSKLAFEKSYVVEVRAQTSKGWGESARQIVTTVKRSAPAKPKAPTVVPSFQGSFTVTYNFEVGGGWTSEFKVLYRKKGGSNEFQETDWVNHFSTQKVEISNLEPEVYEFKIVGRNAVGKSPDSDIVEARLEDAPVIERQESSAVYRSDWFITLMIISAATLLLLIIVFMYRRWKRRQRSNFKVSEHEKEPMKEQNEVGSISVEIKRREEWKKSIGDRLEVESQDSLDEYGGKTPYFTEDGSFVGDLHHGRNRTSVYDTIDNPVA